MKWEQFCSHSVSPEADKLQQQCFYKKIIFFFTEYSEEHLFNCDGALFQIFLLSWMNVDLRPLDTALSTSLLSVIDLEIWFSSFWTVIDLFICTMMMKMAMITGYGQSHYCIPLFIHKCDLAIEAIAHKVGLPTPLFKDF